MEFAIVESRPKCIGAGRPAFVIKFHTHLILMLAMGPFKVVNYIYGSGGAVVTSWGLGSEFTVPSSCLLHGADFTLASEI